MAREIHRYDKWETATSSLNPLEDVMCWIEGLTSARHVRDLLRSNHCLQGPMSVSDRSKTVTGLVQLACKYLDQAAKGPKEVAFLPLYYAFLNLSKACIAIGPHGHELSQNRWHGIAYEADTNMGTLDDIVVLHEKGAIPLFYRTLVGEDMFQNVGAPLVLRMKDVYPYIPHISLEYTLATGRKPRVIPFQLEIAEREHQQRIVVTYVGKEKADFDKIKIGTLQAFRGLHREPDGDAKLVSDWYAKDDTASLTMCLRRAMLYGDANALGNVYHSVPWSRGKLLLPEEFPLICAFFHISSVVRYHPNGLRKLMNSRCWPLLLALRTHGAYRFLQLFWWFVTQRCTYILPA